jgi:hypothetical protein
VESSIEKNVEMRKLVNELVDLAGMSDGDSDLFWRVARDEALKRCPLPKKSETNIRPMSDLEGQRMGRELIGFGTWIDCSYEHVYLQDQDYLNWLADRGMELLRWLKWRKTRT